MKSSIFLCLTPLVLLSISCHITLAQDTTYLDKPPMVINKFSETIALDGLSDEAVWQEATSLPFIMFRPVWGQKPTEKTEMLIGYDDNFLYVAGRCYYQDSTSIIARTLERDGWRGDDWMTLHVDSRYDKQNAFVFSIYPLGSRYDMATSNDAVELGNSTFNDAFNMFWEGESVINGEGWFFEMKIPLYNLRFKEDDQGNVHMGISASRSIQFKQELHQFPAVPQNAIDPIMKPSLKQPIVLKELPKQKLFLFTPYALGQYQRQHIVNEDETQFNRQVERNYQLGFDAKIGVSPYLTLDLSANPDFAQVEADDQLVNLTRFSLFFPERRLFFQEQAGLFEFNLGGTSQLFYSRRIGINDGQLTNIYGGARLTGKLNDNIDIGVLTMQAAPIDLEEGDRIATENFSVVRLRQKIFNDRSFLGTMLTSRVGSGSQNYALGMDALLNPKDIHYFLLSVAHTLQQDSTEGFNTGIDDSRVSFLWETRRTDKLHHKLGYIYSGRNFDPGVGFVARTNYHNVWGNLSYGKFADERKGNFQYQQFTLLGFDGFFNAESGQLETMVASSGISLTSFKGHSLRGNISYNYEYLAEELDFGNDIIIDSGSYHFENISLRFSPPRFKGARLPITLSEGGFFDGRRFNATISPIFYIGKHWEIEAAYDFTYLRFPSRDLYRPIQVTRLRLNYALNLHLSINAVVQYNSTTEQIFNNFRVRYNFKDGHDLFFVWNENFFTDRHYSELVQRPVSDIQNFTIKYYYTFDF